MITFSVAEIPTSYDLVVFFSVYAPMTLRLYTFKKLDACHYFV